MSARVLKAPLVVLVTADEVDERAQAVDERRRADLDEAYRAGVAAGRATGVGAVPEVVACLERAAADLLAAERARRLDDAGSLVVLATELARWLVGRELEADPAAVLATLDRLLDELPPATRLVARVPAELAAVVEERWAPAHHATVVADQSLAPGEATVSVDTGEARLRFDDAFDVARRALESELR